MSRKRSTPLLIAAVLFIGARGVAGQDAARVYDRYSGAVAKVEVLEASSGAPSSVGTAFFVDPSLLLTNYHVVRNLLYQPDRYRLNLAPTDGVEAGHARIVALDPPNDLAVLRVERVHDAPLPLRAGPIPNGEVLYSIGHPADLRTAVVEGVYNGDVEAAVAPLAHFSGSINPGMSGGPTLRSDGEVVGVNVSTAGNQLSFLIPARVAVDLVEEARGVDEIDLDELGRSAQARLLAFQEGFYHDLLAAPLPTATIRDATVPSGPEGPFDCSATPHDVDGDRYEFIEYACTTQDQMILGPRGIYDFIAMEHLYLASDELPRPAYQSVLQSWFLTVLAWEAPENDDATPFECRRRNLAEGLDSEMLVTFCARKHGSYDGLYDVFVRTALLGVSRRGVVSTLRANPISFDNAVALTRRWLEAFAWTP